MRKILFAFFLILVVACSDKPKFTEKIIEKSSGNCEENCLSINLNYLICKRPNKFAENFNKEIESQVVNFLLSNQTDSVSSVEVTVEQGLETFMKDYENLHQYFPEISAYELILNDSISFQNEKLISIVSSRYSYTGGAHGNSSTVLLNFDVSNGELIHNDDLFTDLVNVMQVAENQFKKEQNITSTESLNEKGFWFEDDKFHLPQNIGFSDKYLILYYNPYEIAPYAEGTFEVKIPIDEVKPFLRHF